MTNLLPSDLSKVDPLLAWQPWAPHEQQPWNAKWAGHLFRRAGFGTGPDEIAGAVKLGYSATIDKLLQGDPDTAQREELLLDLGDEFARDEDLAKLRGWWLYAMLNSGHPLREKLILFWHNHFATSVSKVLSPGLMYRQNLLIRKHALGSFRPFLKEMSRDPAMLLWLDSNQNVKSHPNENYAREVMELFSLGVGNYTEKDVQESARAFTGWHTDSAGKHFEFNEQEHDTGQKTVLGAAGNWNGDDVVRIILDRPAAANFLVGKLYRDLVSETEPPKALLQPLSERFRQSDYDIGDLVRTMLRSRLFFSEHAYLKRIKGPIEFALGTVKAAWPGPAQPADLVQGLESMGQALFAPPNVKGWPGGKHWLNDATLIARNNFTEWIATGNRPRTSSVGTPLTLDGTTHVAKTFDVSVYAQGKKASTPKQVVQFLAEQFFPGGIGADTSTKLEAFIAEGNPKGEEFILRIREAAHALLCTPDYQLC